MDLKDRLARIDTRDGYVQHNHKEVNEDTEEEAIHASSRAVCANPEGHQDRGSDGYAKGQHKELSCGDILVFDHVQPYPSSL